MDTEKRLQAIEKELKLLKVELKQTLASVRDTLLNTDLTAYGASTKPSKPDNGGSRPENMEDAFPLPAKDKTKAGSEKKPAAEVETEIEIEETPEEAEPLMAIPELPLEEELMEYKKISPELDKSVPGVNLLANLISWSAIARKEIGDEQLPTLLEVYGISGNLSPEMKDVILNLAEITSKKSGENNPAESWSNSMLALHGILTGK
jgi:hypothetical protein